MSEPFLGEIRLFSFNFAPKGWAFCNGQLLPINQNQALFSILGTTYGGDGRQTFALPNLQGKVPLHEGVGFVLGQTSGEANHALNTSEMPPHTHVLSGTSGAASSASPTNHVLATPAANKIYAGASNLVSLAPQAVANAGGSQPHNNMMPYLVISFGIALSGIFPSQT